MLARDNPFRSSRIDALPYLLRGRSWPDLMRALRELDCRGALVGPKGTGKTTLLLEIERRLRQDGVSTRLVRLEPEASAEAVRAVIEATGNAKQDEVLLVDGAGSMSRAQWERLARMSARLIVTAHTAGLLPTVQECTTDAGLLGEIVRRLDGGEWLALCGGAQALFARRRGNIREALRELYDVCASRAHQADTGSS
jgi:hypothetical protein